MTVAPGPWDDGLQNERTTLAWSRTALSMVAVGLLVARQSMSAVVGGALLIVVLLVAVAMVVGADRRHHRRTERLHAGAAVGALAEVVAVAGTALGLALCGFVVVLT